MTRASLWALALLLGPGLGCGSGEGAPAAPDAGPRVVLGTGRLAFEPLESEARVPVIAGIQGGFHVWVSFLAYGFETEVLHMDLSARWGERDEFEPASVSVAARLGTDPSGMPARVMLGWPALVSYARCSHGQELEVDLAVSDMAGRSASDTRRWVLDVQEVDRSPDCPP